MSMANALGFNAFSFPGFLYVYYGYANYFMAYALYPEVIERGFKIHADASVRHNRIAARAIIEGGLPRLIRLDHGRGREENR